MMMITIISNINSNSNIIAEPPHHSVFIAYHNVIGVLHLSEQSHDLVPDKQGPSIV